MKMLLLTILLSLSAMSSADTGITPDPKLTPGDSYPNIDIKLLCTPNYTAGFIGADGKWYLKGTQPANSTPVRNISSATEAAVWKAYGIQNHTGYCGTSPEGCEVDHLRSLVLNGRNTQENLWPQTYDTKVTWNAHRKDVLEVKLHKLVCSGKLPLATAQTAISTDWRKAYVQYVDPSYAQYLK